MFGDDREPVFDARDAALLDGGDFGDMAVEAEDDDEEYKRYKTDSEEDLYDDNGIQIARKKRKKGQDDKGSEKKAKKAPRKKREARMRPKKVHLASEIAIRRAQWSVGARAPTVVTKPPPQQAEPVEDDSIPRWKRALLAAAPPPAPARRPASKREGGRRLRQTKAEHAREQARQGAAALRFRIAGRDPRADGEPGQRAQGRRRDAERLAQRRDRGGARPGPRGRGGHVESRPRRRAAPGAAARARARAQGRGNRRLPRRRVRGRPAPRAFVKVRPADLPAAERLEAPAAGLDGEVVRAQADVLLHAQGQGFNQVDAAARGEVAPGEEAGAGASIERRRPEARARATLAALEGSLPDSAPPVPADALAAAAAASRWDAPPPDAQGAAAQRYVDQQRRYDAPAGFAPAPPAPGWRPQPRAPRPGEVVRELAVPSQHVGLVVGKGGANLDRMRRLYGGVDTRLGQADEPGAAPPQRRVAFTGMPPDVDRAMADVAGLMRQRGAAATPVHAGAPPPNSGPAHRRRDAGGGRLLRAAAAAGRARAVGEPPLAAGGADAAVTQLLMEADLSTRPGFAPQPPPPSGFAPAPPFVRRLRAGAAEPARRRAPAPGPLGALPAELVRV